MDGLLCHIVDEATVDVIDTTGAHRHGRDEAGCAVGGGQHPLGIDDGGRADERTSFAQRHLKENTRIRVVFRRGTKQMWQVKYCQHFSAISLNYMMSMLYLFRNPQRTLVLFL